MVANSAGTLYCTVPAAATGVGRNLYESTDNGAPDAHRQPRKRRQTVVKTKLLVTGTDSVYCIYQIGDSLFTFSVQSRVTTPFTTMTVEDFDAVAPQRQRDLPFTDDLGNTNVTVTAPPTAVTQRNGSTALVAGDAANPRVCMDGTRLILNYYGPVFLRNDLDHSLCLLTTRPSPEPSHRALARLGSPAFRDRHDRNSKARSWPIRSGCSGCRNKMASTFHSSIWSVR